MTPRNPLVAVGGVASDDCGVAFDPLGAQPDCRTMVRDFGNRYEGVIRIERGGAGPDFRLINFTKGSIAFPDQSGAGSVDLAVRFFLPERTPATDAGARNDVHMAQTPGQCGNTALSSHLPGDHVSPFRPRAHVRLALLPIRQTLC